MIAYVCGFRFNENVDKVLLIEKKKPKWQEGLLNGIGGKVDREDETFKQAIEREFEEETKLGTYDEWSNFAKLTGEKFQVRFYVSFGNDVHDYKGRKEDIGEGVVSLYDYPDVLWEDPVIYNLKYLMPMALEKELRNAVIEVG